MKVRFAFAALLGCWLMSCQLGPTDQFIYVKNAYTICADGETKNCLQIKTSENAPWTNFSDSIDGFQYEEGHFYKLKVNESSIDDATKQVTPLKYALVAVVEKSTTPITLDTGFWIVKSIMDTKTFARPPVFSISDNIIIGNTSCNRFSGNLESEVNSFNTTIKTVTEMACNTMATEQLFLKTIPLVKHYTIKGNQLVLTDGKKEIIMTCIYSPE